MRLRVPLVARFAAAFVAAASAALAHEYWIEPIAKSAKPGEPVELEAWIGQGFRRDDRKALTLQKLEALRWVDAGGEVDLLAGLGENDSVTRVTPRAAGPALVWLASAPSTIELEPAKFDEYLREVGLEAIRDRRKREGTSEQPGRERYRRCAKSVVAVGGSAGSETDAVATRAVGLRYELVPAASPLALRPGGALRVAARFEGKPLANSAIRAWRRAADAPKQPKEAFAGRTDAQGIVVVPVAESGDWLVASTHMVPCNDEGLDWDSFWASLTFRVDAPASASAPAAPAATSRPR